MAKQVTSSWPATKLQTSLVSQRARKVEGLTRPRTANATSERKNERGQGEPIRAVVSPVGGARQTATAAALFRDRRRLPGNVGGSTSLAVAVATLGGATVLVRHAAIRLRGVRGAALVRVANEPRGTLCVVEAAGATSISVANVVAAVDARIFDAPALTVAAAARRDAIHATFRA
jgi:hypothetical protein